MELMLATDADMRPGTPWSSFLSLPERLGHRRIAVHDLVEAGFDVAEIANAGGWKSLMMPNYYTRELRAK